MLLRLREPHSVPVGTHDERAHRIDRHLPGSRRQSIGAWPALAVRAASKAMRRPRSERKLAEHPRRQHRIHRTGDGRRKPDFPRVRRGRNAWQDFRADLFDNNYVPIPGTNPLQHRTRFLEFTEQVLPAIQEPLLASDKRMVFCAAVDRNRLSAGPQHDPIASRNGPAMCCGTPPIAAIAASSTTAPASRGPRGAALRHPELSARHGRPDRHDVGNRHADPRVRQARAASARPTRSRPDAA